MAGSARYIRSEVGEIERQLRSLEKTIEKLGSRTSSRARDTAGAWLMQPRWSYQGGLHTSEKVQTRLVIDLLQQERTLRGTGRWHSIEFLKKLKNARLWLSQ